MLLFALYRKAQRVEAYIEHPKRGEELRKHYLYRKDKIRARKETSEWNTWNEALIIEIRLERGEALYVRMAPYLERSILKRMEREQ